MNSINKLTSPFALDDRYYFEFEDYIEDLINEEIPHTITFANCELRKVVSLDRSVINEMLLNKFEENSSEHHDEWIKVGKVVDDFFTDDFLNMINEKMPSLWWPEGESIVITKDEILEYADFYGIELQS